MIQFVLMTPMMSQPIHLSLLLLLLLLLMMMTPLFSLSLMPCGRMIADWMAQMMRMMLGSQIWFSWLGSFWDHPLMLR
jgi:hypothetical protein